ncbi:radical sam domain protein [Novosphingobium sp. Rr 2-17]|uniref:radical SAM protein n=1 Tax=Novosphingobium sp. Rr 2-17 TaxID=555793 RepID=UPI0002699EEA|nr:radical SAM protein [Novosphingobium sp. Rr 2-17]EIZ78442.1 radical sam domain protein [Novosphingobium sp. Rr 2-17]
MPIQQQAMEPAEDCLIDAPTAAQQAIDIMLSIMSDGLDHPELWILVPAIVAENPLIPQALHQRSTTEQSVRLRVQMQMLLGLSIAAGGSPRDALDGLMPLSAGESQNVQVQGVLFHLEGLIDPTNPKYQLTGKVCLRPFIELDVLEGTTHLCCASWLPTSTGNLAGTPWRDVWNGDVARAIRTSMLDGSYRYCNKRTCPTIQSSQFRTIEELKADPQWSDIVTGSETIMARGPEILNLSYDRTCNLSCPSCRSSAYAADEQTRINFDTMQQNEILPLLKNAKSVFVTGSGDPFASKNFRRLMEQLDAQEYPELKFIIMTNGMLLTPRQWAAFPSLHKRVESLRISLDAATGPTHELLRRGARWSVMEQNLKFAGELLNDGLIDDLMITFTVQSENFREMGDAVDLAHQIGASHVYFGRMTNWGTFTTEQYMQKAVFVPGHPDHEEFVAACSDPRLRDPIVSPSDLDEFFKTPAAREWDATASIAR